VILWAEDPRVLMLRFSAEKGKKATLIEMIYKIPLDMEPKARWKVFLKKSDRTISRI
jgi:hypothetical protein